MTDLFADRPFAKYCANLNLEQPYDVFIGRPSLWGNPFSHLSHSRAVIVVQSRAEAIQKFREWLYARPALMQLAKERLRGKTLGCYCSPAPCHGEVLAEIANTDP